MTNQLDPNDNLGRRVLSSSSAKKNIRFHVFLERYGIRTISVDLLKDDSHNTVQCLAEQAAEQRGRTFYGWAVVPVFLAEENGRDALASPIDDNPFHADIRLPTEAEISREIQKRHAKELADFAVWHPK